MLEIPNVKPQIPATVNNIFVWQLYSKAGQIYQEIAWSDSANTSSGISQEDLRRIKQNVGAFKLHLNYVKTQVEVPLDYPEFKKIYPIKPLIPEGENPPTDNSDILVLLDLAQTVALIPVTSGQTLKTNTMYHRDDMMRLEAAVGALEAYVAYLETEEFIPLDLPITSSRTKPIFPPANVTGDSE